MAACPDCAETYGWRQRWLQRPCGYCGAASVDPSDGKARSYARAHGAEILAQPRGVAFWVYLGVVVSTAVLAPFATQLALAGGPLAIAVGAAAAAIVLVVTSACNARANLRYTSHFDTLHGMVYGTYSSLLLFLFVGVWSLLQALPVVGQVAGGVFAGYWFLDEAFARRQFAEVARGERPSGWLLAPFGVVAVVAIVPTVVVSATLCYAVWTWGG